MGDVRTATKTGLENVAAAGYETGFWLRCLAFRLRKLIHSAQSKRPKGRIRCPKYPPIRHASVAENTPRRHRRNRTVIVSGVPLPSIGRATQTGRHRPVSLDQDPQAPGRELENYLAALAPETELESTGAGRRFGNAQVYQLRLQLMADQQLRELAEQLGTSPQALAQDWVVQRLQWEASQREPVPAWP